MVAYCVQDLKMFFFVSLSVLWIILNWQYLFFLNETFGYFYLIQWRQWHLCRSL